MSMYKLPPDVKEPDEWDSDPRDDEDPTPEEWYVLRLDERVRRIGIVRYGIFKLAEKGDRTDLFIRTRTPDKVEHNVLGKNIMRGLRAIIKKARSTVW